MCHILVLGMGLGQKSPNNDEKWKLMFFCYTFFYIDSDIRYIIKYKGKKIKNWLKKINTYRKKMSSHFVYYY